MLYVVVIVVVFVTTYVFFTACQWAGVLVGVKLARWIIARRKARR